jgi:hypothetical protein
MNPMDTAHEQCRRLIRESILFGDIGSTWVSMRDAMCSHMTEYIEEHQPNFDPEYDDPDYGTSLDGNVEDQPLMIACTDACMKAIKALQACMSPDVSAVNKVIECSHKFYLALKKAMDVSSDDDA